MDDVVVGDWRRPWNRKRSEKKQYKPENDPYTLWAETAEGRDQVGCVYSAQGFEFDRVGVLWGEDLVWRGSQWVSQKQRSFDRPVKGNSQMTRLVRNAYRVLLTRGMKQTRLLCMDSETRAHVAAVLAEVQQQIDVQHLSRT